MAEMLTEDRRCGWCGEPVTEVQGKPRMVDGGHGWMEVESVSYVLTPCGHVFTKTMRPAVT